MNSNFVETFVLQPLKKHENADSLSIAQIGETAYTYVCKTEEWSDKIGKLVCWIPPDSIVDISRPEFSFLTNARVRAKKLRGIVSYGLLVLAPEGLKEGDDGASALGVKHYDPDSNNTSSGLGGNPGEVVAPPKLHAPKYDVDSFLKYGKKVFVENEEVYITEKLHGCLLNNTKILMADGTYKRIGSICKDRDIGKEVIGVDEDGKVVSTPILNVFNNGSEITSWFKIKGKRENSGRGGHEFAVECTGNHLFWNAQTKAYTPADKLKIGDEILTLRMDFDLSPLQKQVLLGKILGDGSLNKVNQENANLEFRHSVDQLDYIKWTLRGLGNIACNKIIDTKSGFGSDMKAARTVSTPLIKEYLKDFILDGKKIIPEKVVEEISPIGLAFLYMDDGSLSHVAGQEDRVSFALCGFTEQDCAVFKRALEKFNIQSVFFTSTNTGSDSSYSRIRLNAVDAEKFFLLVAPYIPPSMQYKLPERYRGHPGWLPVEDVFKAPLCPQKILEITEMPRKKRIKWDMETGTHNFFANRTLVHNSNFRTVFDEYDREMHVGSRNEWKSEFTSAPKLTLEYLTEKVGPEKAQEVYKAKVLDFKPKKSQWWALLDSTPALRAFCEKNPGYVVYGESYGNNKKFKYDCAEELKFRAFDILTPKGWMSSEDFLATCQEFGIPHVPILYRGPFNFEKALALAEGDSTLGKHIREGCVIKPKVERQDPNIGRVSLKIINPKFLETN